MDVYAFLDIDHPLCAWATYRGVLVSAPKQPGFLSVWSAGLMREELPRIWRETQLEKIRLMRFPDRVSRLTGMFCFPDLKSSEYAYSWGGHFRPEYRAQLHLEQHRALPISFDSNWITYAPHDDKGFVIDTADWMSKYWSGEPYPNGAPVWETLVDGRLIVRSTNIRKKAYENIKGEFPNSLAFLEIARLAAYIGSNMGNICAHIDQKSDEMVLQFLMDMRDATDPETLKRLGAVVADPSFVNSEDLKPQLSHGLFGQTPDLRTYGFRRPMLSVQL